MSRCLELEEKANRFAADRLREIRGETPRVKLCTSLGMGESMLHAYESGKTKIPVGRLASMARTLNVSLSSFILPDDDNDLHMEDSEVSDQQPNSEKKEAVA